VTDRSKGTFIRLDLGFDDLRECFLLLTKDCDGAGVNCLLTAESFNNTAEDLSKTAEREQQNFENSVKKQSQDVTVLKDYAESTMNELLSMYGFIVQIISFNSLTSLLVSQLKLKTPPSYHRNTLIYKPSPCIFNF
jgi:hypothetical protein